LYQIDSGQTQALDLIIDNVQNSKQGVPYSAFYYLRRIGPTAKRAVPILLQQFEIEDSSTLRATASALWYMGETNLLLTKLGKRLPDIEAAHLILQFDPTNTQAITNLMASVYDARVTARAAKELTALRPVPPIAEPVLQAIALQKGNAARQAAIKAL